MSASPEICKVCQSGTTAQGLTKDYCTNCGTNQNDGLENVVPGDAMTQAAVHSAHVMSEESDGQSEQSSRRRKRSSLSNGTPCYQGNLNIKRARSQPLPSEDATASNSPRECSRTRQRTESLFRWDTPELDDPRSPFRNEDSAGPQSRSWSQANESVHRVSDEDHSSSSPPRAGGWNLDGISNRSQQSVTRDLTAEITSSPPDRQSLPPGPGTYVCPPTPGGLPSEDEDTWIAQQEERDRESVRMAKEELETYAPQSPRSTSTTVHSSVDMDDEYMRDVDMGDTPMGDRLGADNETDKSSENSPGQHRRTELESPIEGQALENPISSTTNTRRISFKTPDHSDSSGSPQYSYQEHAIDEGVSVNQLQGFKDEATAKAAHARDEAKAEFQDSMTRLRKLVMDACEELQSKRPDSKILNASRYIRIFGDLIEQEIVAYRDRKATLRTEEAAISNANSEDEVVKAMYAYRCLRAEQQQRRAKSMDRHRNKWQTLDLRECYSQFM
ncbi:hypothetical protein MMC24_000848 [Lignoscripta atroalba]|nr:hypothetical protein [Lignoscripta atroalba]